MSSPPVLPVAESSDPRVDALRAAFLEKFGKAPDFIARAPGRVNLIGEHIDYSGYAVLPMAIQQDVLIAVAPNDSDELRIANVNAKFAPRTYPAFPVNIDKETFDWGNYVLCGYKGLLEEVAKTGEVVVPPGLSFLVDGVVPAGSGLSSSSALVCCAALATNTAVARAVAKAGAPVALLSKQALAELCARCERYVGTEGGGMDQATSFLGESGCAKLIEFNPVRATTVPLPAGGVFVIANSLVAAHKYVSAGSCFNKRVVECRLAARLVAVRAGVPNATAIRTLGQLQAALGASLADMGDLVATHLHAEPYTPAELSAALAISLDELNNTLLSPTTVTQPDFNLLARARHVYTEANHVLVWAAAFRDAGAAGALEELGRLMTASHTSCSQDYACSCPELDRLTELCRSHGALGSRLTGAGWGGCTVSLVPEAKLASFLARVKADYFDQLPPGSFEAIETVLFPSKPGPGACVFADFS